jgi:MurNAc alpha-1-phosphate uridylyltransferase
MQAMILAAGIGERMRPLTLVKPKPLLEVCGLTLIEHHIINLKKAGYTKLVINVCWLAQQIMQKLGNGNQYGVEIRYSFEGNQPLETGGGIFKALSLLDNNPFLVVNSDIKTDIDFRNIHYDDRYLAHLVLVNNPDHNLNGDFSLDKNKHLSSENTLNKHTYSGVGIYHPDLFNECKSGIYSVTPLLKKAMLSQKVTGQLHCGHWDDIGTIDRLIKINTECK